MEIVGRIVKLKVTHSSAYVTVRERNTNADEVFVIFDVSLVPEHEDLSAFDWILFSMQVSLAREALAGGLEVLVVTAEDTSPVISYLELHAPIGL